MYRKIKARNHKTSPAWNITKPLPKTIFQGKNCKASPSLTGLYQAFLTIYVKMSNLQCKFSDIDVKLSLYCSLKSVRRNRASLTLENLISLTTLCSRPHSPRHCPPCLCPGLWTTRCWLLCWLCVGVCISPALLISCAAQQLRLEPAAGSSAPASAGWRLPGLPSPAQPSPAQTSPAVTSLAA